MKKLLLIGLILAICVLAMPQGVMADIKGDTATINAKVNQAELRFDVTSTAPTWELNRGANIQTDANRTKVEVDSSTTWTVAAIGTTGGGYMWSVANNAILLKAPVNIYSDVTSEYKPLTASVAVHDGIAGDYADTVFYTRLSQFIGPTDSNVPTYQIVITYTCTEH